MTGTLVCPRCRGACETDDGFPCQRCNGDGVLIPRDPAPCDPLQGHHVYPHTCLDHEPVPHLDIDWSKA